MTARARFSILLFASALTVAGGDSDFEAIGGGTGGTSASGGTGVGATGGAGGSGALGGAGGTGSGGAGGSSSGGSGAGAGGSETGGGAGVGGSGTGGSGGVIDPAALHFGPMSCEHALLGATLAEGTPVICAFDVMGTAGHQVDFTCVDAMGASVSCDCMSPTQVQPCSPAGRTIPFRAGVYGSATAPRFFLGMEGNDGTGTAQTDLDFAVVAANANGVNDVPVISVDCGGDTDLDVETPAGTQLDCRIAVVDGDDVESVNIRLNLDSGPGNIGPVGILGTPPLVSNLRITSNPGDAGGTAVIGIEVEDPAGANPPAHVVTTTLTVHFR